MASRVKRYSYVSDEVSSSDTDGSDETHNSSGRRSLVNNGNNVCDSGHSEVVNEVNKRLSSYNLKGKKMMPKSFSRNALLARENRLKKKMYINSLENEVAKLRKLNKKLNAVVENQSILISDMKKEVRYLRSVLANSPDIGKLVRNIHQNTGMSVTTSLDHKLSLKNCISKPSVPIARKTAHPWEEQNGQPTDSSLDSLFPSVFTEDYFNNLNEHDLCMEDFSFNINDHDIEKENYSSQLLTSVIPSEHNYSNQRLVSKTEKDLESEEDVGVCLHVSKHKVSLEFCPSCSENASTSWMK